MQQRSQNSKKEEKTKTDGKGKWEKKGQKKLFLAEFQLTFVLVKIKNTNYPVTISDTKVKRNGTNGFVQGI